MSVNAATSDKSSSVSEAGPSTPKAGPSASIRLGTPPPPTNPAP
eukprot:CAMPEP_0180185766 /NCGR_PEP_ID=MMETSP0986-20121125/42583_1 /TAXON_ID=697907 /ORGANISM="non described non described, Strain CCMP2293" /LENGTH=43 /DNA_ID= /DNA_START= /DNA_END= /DNA_ORIENTATION=